MKLQRISPEQKAAIKDQINETLALVSQFRDQSAKANKQAEKLLLQFEKEALIFSSALNSNTNFDLRTLTAAFTKLGPQSEKAMHSFNKANDLLGNIWNDIGWDLGRYESSK